VTIKDEILNKIPRNEGMKIFVPTASFLGNFELLKIFAD